MTPSPPLRVLVTGGAGFIGGHVARACVEAGHRVTVFDNLSRGRSENVPPSAELVVGDLRDYDFGKLFNGSKFDVINHHAAHMDLRESVREPVFDAEVNVTGSLRLLEAGRNAGVRRVIFASTGGAIYGEPQGHSAGEEHPTVPVSPYGVTKLAVERYLHFYRVEYGLSAVVLRYANVYGPRQDGKGEAGVVAIFLDNMLAGKAPSIHGDGQQTRDYVYVGDCVRANLAALSYPGDGIWNVGTGVEISVNRLYQELAARMNFPKPGIHDDPPPGEQRRSLLDGSKLLRDFGIQRYTPLAEGLDTTVEWFRRRG